jgi:hypothetical protein
MIDYDKWCRQCKNYEFKMESGVLCGLTHEKPDFVEECKDYVHDETREEKLKNEERKYFFSGKRQQTAGIFMMVLSAIWILGVFAVMQDIPILPTIIFISGLVIYIRGRKITKGK